MTNSNNDHNMELAITLAMTEKETDVVDILKKEGYWNNYDYWRPFGDNDNNFSTIGNQQSAPDAALVEKIINSVDAILMKECYIRGIKPDSPQAPQSINDALYQFFRIQDGQISNLSVPARNAMSKNIVLAATGSKRHMNLTIADRGEGQTPERMPDTILSISKNNKLKIPFVQGKFNMGGTGVLPFCGENKFQLIISRRCPDILCEENDKTAQLWSVTIVRREEAREGRKSSMFTYLTDKNGDLLTFEADEIPIIPAPKNKPHENMAYGTYFKLFNYAIQRYKSNILFDFNYRLSELMPELAHPFQLRECREYEGHTFETTQTGLRVRLLDDRANNIEEGFPTSEVITIEGQEIRCSIYVFKKGRSQNYREKDGVLFVVNGQTHAILRDSFFNRANLSYLADSILVIVDCSDVDITHREDMFMNSRDRLRSDPFSREIEDQLKSILSSHSALKKLQNERRASAVQERLSDDKPLQDVLQNILTKSPVLSKLLVSGARLSDPFNTKSDAGIDKEFKGRRHPTFFKLKSKSKNILVKSVPINSDFRVQFETDAENDYFARPDERGKLSLFSGDIPVPEMKKHLGLLNGTATLTISLPKDAEVGNEYTLRTEIEDEYIGSSFENEFKVVATEAVDKPGSNSRSGNRTPPQNRNEKGQRENPSGVGIPEVTEIYKSRWDEFGADKNAALIVMSTDEGSDYFINMDNQYLLLELKGKKDQNDIALTKARYKYSMILIGMSVQSYYKNQSSAEEDDANTSERIKEISSMLAPILIPMIQAMADLDIESI